MSDEKLKSFMADYLIDRMSLKKPCRWKQWLRGMKAALTETVGIVVRSLPLCIAVGAACFCIAYLWLVYGLGWPR